MATTVTNNLLQRMRGGVLTYPVDSAGTSTFNQGDLVYYDTTAKLLKAVGSDANAATLAGVALISSSLALYTNALTGSANSNIEPKAMVGFGDIFTFTGTAGDTYNHGDAVYYATDAQHVTNVAATNKLGYIWAPLKPSLVGAVTVPVLVVALYPVTLG